MKTIKTTRLSVLTRCIEHERQPRFIVGVLAGFKIGADKELVAEVEMWPTVVEALANEGGILDEGMAKTRGEVLVTGDCFPPDGPAPVSYAGFSLKGSGGNIDKRVAVIGDREWKSGVPTEPKPFEMMPVDWTRAFGGTDHEPNPQGRGAAPVEQDGVESHPLPNIEDPKRLIRSPRDTPEPAGFGAISIQWPQRKKKMGTKYGAKWLEERAFGFAEDIDPTVFNMATSDQWLSEFFTGDETFVIENMHPEHKRLEGSLPPLAVRVFITRRVEGEEEPKLFEVFTRLETLRLFPGSELGVMIYRGVLDVAEDDAEDVVELLIAGEDKSAPRDEGVYHRAIIARRDHEKAGFLALAETDLAPQKELGWKMGVPAAVEDIPKPEYIVQENLARSQTLAINEARERLEAQGLDPDAFDLGTQGAVPEVDYDDPEQMAELIQKQKQEAEEHQKKVERERDEQEAKLRKVFEDEGYDYDEEVDKVKKEAAGPPDFDANKQLEQIEKLLAIARDNDQPMEELEQQIRDPEYVEMLHASEKRLKDVYRIGAHRQEPMGPVPNDAAAMFRAELEVAHVNEIGLEARDFSGADLSNMRLAGIDLQGGFFEATDLTDTDLSGANLSRVVLAHANLCRTKLGGANLEGANLGAAKLVDVDLSGARLTKTILDLAHFERCSLRGVVFDSTSMMEAEFGEGVDMSEATAELMVFLRLDLREVNLSRARFQKCAFVECDLRGAVLEDIDLTATCLVTCQLDGANLKRATLAGTQFVVGTTLAGADFRGATLHSASLRGLDMRGCNLTGVTLDCADLSKSDLREAELAMIHAHKAMFMRTDLRGVDMRRADLMSALLTKAKLQGTNLEDANLFQADVAQVRTDGNTNLARANMGRTRQHPKAKN
jgi:uncharacterized protein YjbI with pentapeptide repeats